MARTPLFRMLQRSFRLARHSVVTGRPAEEVAGLTRRQLLGGAAAAAGLSLVGCRPFAPPARTAESGGGGRRVVIVGGGIAGLTA
ncbi:MAG TPA: twin-arginine translocation signal domain-containing protein, partial [Thermoanaerobaculia bacterium]|nr:twin-arginine translocation signal domain-containing protein [Thermoanaerobaculia bacterium]